jgi:ribonuclease HI
MQTPFLFKDMFKNTLYLFTDGACTKNGKLGAMAGVGIYSSLFTKSFPLPGDHHTNQRAELYAIFEALKECKQRDVFNTNINIVSDSMYSINCVNVWCHKWIKNNWNDGTVKNRDIIEPLLLCKNELEKSNQITFKHINSHKKAPEKGTEAYDLWYGNNEADRLAVMAIQEITKTAIALPPSSMCQQVAEHLKTCTFCSKKKSKTPKIEKIII